MGTAGLRRKANTKDMKKMKTDCQSRITRRGFIGAAASATAFTIVPRHVLAGSGKTPPSEKLNIACIGVGGKGIQNVKSVSTDNLVALCDVDEKRGAEAFEMHPKAKRYSDWRRLLDKEEKNIDAVVVTTPDHVHIPVSVMALKMGKHVYCEKPLGHNVNEIRVVTEVARESGLATQLGTSNHSSRNYRGVVELIKAGTIGHVREVHVSCDNEWDPLPRVAADASTLSPRDRRPEETPPVPKHLKWNLWLGPAPVRPYHPSYHPIAWRGWWDFGNGRLGDMGCHLIDLPFSALDLKYPLTVEAEGPHRAGLERAPRWLISKWTFAARGDQPP
ncbi:MAG: Gfo/Idh/MocA family oxidoreductase, partial [Planctomycetes bacterium]|nr:Gfo/Idh/MocA family oxidoreductase [Planctomycetota bacterium]